MIKLSVEEYKKGEVYFIKKGYSKHYLYFDGVDVKNTILFFALYMFNDIEIEMDCDIKFWKEWLDFFQEQTGVRRDNIKFTGKQIDIAGDKIDDHCLWYSGGKDSEYAHQDAPQLRLIQFIAQVYGIKEHPHALRVSSSFDNEIFHCRLQLRKWLKTELFFPLISPFRHNHFGYEKEVWENSKIMCNYDMPKYQALLDRHGMLLDSPSREVYSGDILKYLHKEKIDFIKCDATDYGKENKFCYSCQKCITAYAMGCNLDDHGFDRNVMFHKMRSRVSSVRNLFHAYVDWYCEYNGYPELNDYFKKIAEKNNVS